MFLPIKIDKITLGSNYDKRIVSIDLIGTYVYGTSKGLVGEKKILNVTI